MSIFKIAGVLGAVALFPAQGAFAATVQTQTQGCGSPQFETFTEIGSWSREGRSSDNVTSSNVCTGGTYSLSGSGAGVFAETEVTAEGVQPSVTDQSISDGRSSATYDFMVVSDPSYTGGDVLLTITADFLGTYNTEANFEGTSGGAAAFGRTSATMFIDTIFGQQGIERTGESRTNTSLGQFEVTDEGTVTDTITLSRLVTPDTIFDVNLTALSFSSASARFNQFGGISADAFSNTTASLSFASITVDQGFCVQSVSAAIDTCASDPTDPVDPVPTVPLPASMWLLMAGLGGIAVTRRRR